MTTAIDITDVQKGQTFETKGGALQPFASADDFRLSFQMAKQLASSSLVPDRFKGSPMDCLLGLDMAFRTEANPLMVLQNLYMVHGSPGWSGQYIIAAINRSGRFAEPLHFEFVGTEGQDDWGCYALGITNSGREIKGPTVTIKMAKAEGWHGKNPKWRNIPELMLRYRAGAWFGKTECPEILMGMPAADELQDIIDVDPDTGEVLGGRVNEVPQTPADFGGKDTTENPEPVSELKEAMDEEGARVTAEIEDRGFYSKEVDGVIEYFNAAHQRWDAEAHALSAAEGLPIVNKDGTFKAKRVYKKAEETTVSEDQNRAAHDPQDDEDGYGLD